jgi:hypothetical protein
MSYTKVIEIYKILNSDFVTPLAEAPEKKATYIDGDLVIIFDDKVWVENHDNGVDEYSLALYSPSFVRLNKMLFEKIQ